MKISNTQTFEFNEVYDLADLAKIIGAKLGGKFVADTPDEPLNGYITQQILTYPDGKQKALVTVYFYDDDEDPIVAEPINDNDPEDVKQMKIRQKHIAHSNPFRKLGKSKTRELSIEGEIKKIKSGKLNIRKNDDAIDESKLNEPKRRKEYFDKVKKQTKIGAK